MGYGEAEILRVGIRPRGSLPPSDWSERCLQAVFRFLLDREPKESILDVTAISRYFPEFEREIPHYLSQF